MIWAKNIFEKIQYFLWEFEKKGGGIFGQQFSNFFNPLAHDSISNHRISMKFLPQVKGQNTSYFYSCRFLILSTRSGIIGRGKFEGRSIFRRKHETSNSG